jgi:A/G-specific adenine glycosylase
VDCGYQAQTLFRAPWLGSTGGILGSTSGLAPEKSYDLVPLEWLWVVRYCFDPMTKKRKSPAAGWDASLFRGRLLAWYDEHKRDLPWRGDRDPYRVWLSEIMLQQTRVAAVVEHYKLFVKRFPTVRKLAAARESSVLAAWSGLGYYRRVRMLHAAARKIIRERRGEFPSSANELLTLPGVGRYTSAAVASIAFGEPAAVVDGNVERVIQRVQGRRTSGDAMWQAAEELLDKKRPGDFNQAMMELGATVCIPRQPKCLICPVNELCATRGEHPRREKSIRQQKREIGYALNLREGSVLMVQRSRQASLMAGMWELPELPHPNGAEPMLTLRHSITTTDYTVRIMDIDAPAGTQGKWVRTSQLAKLPLTGLARKILRNAGILENIRVPR